MTYRLLIEVHDDDRGPEDGGKPWAANATTADGAENLTIAAGLGSTPWEALADLQVDWDALGYDEEA